MLKFQTLIAAAIVALALVAHALMPRYEIRSVAVGSNDVPVFARIDHWRGSVTVGFLRAGALPSWMAVETSSK